MTITLEEYRRRTAHAHAAPVHPHRPTIISDIWARDDIPAPVGPPVLDDRLLMVRLRADALAESWRLRESLTGPPAPAGTRLADTNCEGRFALATLTGPLGTGPIEEAPNP